MKGVLGAIVFVFMTAAALQAAPLTLVHGVGVHEWLNWSPLNEDGSYRWPPYRSEKEWLSGARPLSDWPHGDEFVRIRSLGFDFIRLSVDPGPLLDSDGKRRQQALEVLADAVRQVTKAKLKVVFNLHSVSQVPAYSMDLVNGGADSAGIARYREMVASVAGMLVKIGTDKVAIEPYNEPAYYPCDAGGSEDWQRIMAATVSDIRAVSRDLTIVATGACGGDITGLEDIRPGFDDANIYYSLHMYDPHSFTHQRLDDPSAFMSSLPWPADSSTPEAVVKQLKAYMRAAGLSKTEQNSNLMAISGAINKYFAEDFGLKQMQNRMGHALDWAKANKIPAKRLFMGEFGVILISKDGRMGAPNPDRLRYLKALRQQAEASGIPWSIWEYSNPYGMTVIVPKGPAVPDKQLMKALGLR